MTGAGGYHPDMLSIGEIIERQNRPVELMALSEQTHVALSQKATLKKSRLKIG